MILMNYGQFGSSDFYLISNQLDCINSGRQCVGAKGNVQNVLLANLKTKK